MDPLRSLGALAVLHLLAVMTPGPNVAIVSHQAAARSRRAGLLAVGGVVTGGLLWVGLSLGGVGLLLGQAPWLYRLLQLLGAAWLFWLGARMILAASHAAAEAEAAPGWRSLARSPYVSGLLTNLTNPKSAIYWTSLFAVALPATAPGWFYGAVLVLVSTLSLLWYGFVAVALSTAPARRLYAELAGWLDATTGTVMAFVGAGMAWAALRDLTG